jgi:predicted RNA-binding protein Jag
MEKSSILKNNNMDYGKEISIKEPYLQAILHNTYDFIKKNKDIKHMKKEIPKEEYKKIVQSRKNLTYDMFEKDVQTRIDEARAEFQNKSPLIHEQYNLSIAEAVILHEFTVPDKKVPKFSKEMFDQLWCAIKFDNPKLYMRLKNLYQMKPIAPVRLLVPNSLYKEFNFIKTAGAAADVTIKGRIYNALFVFNTDFMSQLITMAWYKKIQGYGSKYVSNGGYIPDCYAYIETVIVHELTHYIFGHCFMGEQYLENYTKNAENQDLEKQKMRLVLNMAMDLTINHILKKEHYIMPPGANISKHINYDKQKTFKEIVSIVKKEIYALKEEEFKQLSSMSDKFKMDDHQQPQNSQQNGNGQQSGDSSDGCECGGSCQGQGKNGEQQEGDSSGGGSPCDCGQKQIDEFNKNVDSAAKDIEKSNKESTAKRCADDYSQDDVEKDKKQRLLEASKAKANFNHTLQNLKDQPNSAVQGMEKDFSPKVPWQAIVKNMMSNSKEKMESYVKINARKMASSLQIGAKTTGNVVLNPGKITVDGKQKNLCFLIDNSGSVFDAMSTINNELLTLMKKHKKLINKVVYVKFSSGWELYIADVAKGTYKKIDKPDTITKKSLDNALFSSKSSSKNREMKLERMFDEAMFCGTNFSDDMIDMVEILSKNYLFNTVLITDTDILGGNNLNNLKRLLAIGKKRKNSVQVLMDNGYSFRRVVETLKGNFRNISKIMD